MDFTRDGHIHSHYCPHGTNDSFEQYINTAIERGLKEITFTEHLPLPAYIMDNKKFMDECSPNKETMYKYFEEATTVKEKYKDKIKINVGCEVDYIEGYEDKITEMLNEFSKYIDDAILSVHFIKIGDNKYTDIDGEEGFCRAAVTLGSTEKVYDKYYETLLMAVKSDLGKFKPKRIGHPNLIRIFNKLYKCHYNNEKLLTELAEEIKDRDYEVDVNTAGIRKVYCGEIYVNGFFKKLVKKLGIKEVFGSDAHNSNDVGKGFELYKDDINE